MRLMQQVTILLALATSLHAIPATVRPDVCQTSECVALSALITSNMNLTADPCEDFVEYACGHYPENTAYDPASVTWIPNSEPMLMQSGLTSMVDKLSSRVFELLLFERKVSSEDADVRVMYSLVRRVFSSCTSWATKQSEQRSSGNSKAFFNGVLTHLMGSIDTQKQDKWFERVLAKMVRFGLWPLIEVMPSRNMMRGRASEAGNSSRVHIRHGANFYPATADYRNYTNFFRTLDAASKLSMDSPEEFELILAELGYNATKLETGLIQSKLFGAKKNCCDSDSTYKFNEYNRDITVGELDTLSGIANPKNKFSWKAFFDAILVGNVDEDMLIEFGTMNDAVEIVNLVNYFKQKAFNASHGKFSTHFSFLVFDWLLSFSDFFPKTLATQWEESKIRRSRIPPLVEDPIENCMMLTKTLLGPVVERMYQKAYHAETFDHVRNLVELIRNATILSVGQKKWITSSSKEAIVNKIVALKHAIGFEVFTVQQLKTFYAPIIHAFKAGNYSKSSDNFGMLFSLAACAYAGRRNNLLSSETPTSVFMSLSPLTVNAFNFMQENKIVFPMGILSPFLYHRSYPDYMNLGGIGVVIGHEIGHGFDNEGHELNQQGVRGHFWDNKTEAAFLSRMECVRSRYGSYDLVPGKLHNSNSTVGNDIADLMGIQAAFGALRMLGARGRQLRLPNLPDSLTPERLFFVQSAQAWCTKTEPDALMRQFGHSSHSPPHLRIRGMMENSHDFANVFQCRHNKAMNPQDKCEFW